MNETLLLVWAAIAIIGIISIIIVKIYYSDKKEEEYEIDDITTKTPLQEMVTEEIKNNYNTNERTNQISNYFSKEEEPVISLRKEGTEPEKEFNPYIIPETSENIIPNRNISYSSQNQVLINYDDNVQKFQEPITETQRDIMNQNTKESEEKHELKDLFTIDELIKESKRKDDEREKESKTINKETVDNSDIKESIKMQKEGVESEKIEEVSENKDVTDIKSSIEKMHEIANAIKSTGSDDLTPKSIASQKDINEAINTATSENEAEKEEIPIISEPNSITDAVLKKESEPEEETTVQETLDVKEEPEEEKTESISDAIPESEEIKTAPLKSPTKVEEDSVSILSGADEDYDFGASIDSSNLFEDENGQLSYLDNT